MMGGASRLLLLFPIVAPGGVAFAQDEPVPPSIVELPPIELPEDAAAIDSVEVTIDIDVEGRARLFECAYADNVCARIAEAVAAARFTPATQDGVPIPARIVLRLRVARRPAVQLPEIEIAAGAAPVPVPVPVPVPETATGTDAPPDEETESDFGATATVERLIGQPRRLEVAEMRDMPGAFGDAYRAVDALPGVTPIASGVPYFYLRGSPPNGTLYVYDDIPVPALFHLALGPAVIHPRMVGPVRLHSGVAPARYGRLTGGVVVGEGPPEPTGDVIGELEVRLIDVMGFVQIPVGRGHLTMAARYGFPGLLLTLFSPRLSLQYWDYQARLDYPINARDRLQLVWFGSFDSFGQEGRRMERDQTLDLQFHRAEVRFIRRAARVEYGTALRFGFERSATHASDPADDAGIDATSFGSRIWLLHERPRLKLRAGADFLVSVGEITLPMSASGGDNIADPTDGVAYAGVPGRSIGGGYAEIAWDVHERWTLELGARADVWTTSGTVEPAADPRLRIIYRPADAVDLHVAFGLAHQPAVFAIPLPGLTEIPLDRGLQRSIQAEAGIGVDLPGDFRAELQGFIHRYSQLFFVDPFLGAADECPSAIPACQAIRDDVRQSGTSYGGELFVRRPPEHEWSGFVSYTLARATADPVAGILHYTPSYDVRHVLNVVLAWRHRSGFQAGLRGHLRTGRPVGVLFEMDLAEPRFEQVTRRLPAFFRLDAQVGYAWEPRWGRLRVALEWFNVTIAREPQNIDCNLDVEVPFCEVEYSPALFLPNLGLRADF